MDARKLETSGGRIASVKKIEKRIEIGWNAILRASIRGRATIVKQKIDGKMIRLKTTPILANLPASPTTTTNTILATICGHARNSGGTSEITIRKIQIANG